MKNSDIFYAKILLFGEYSIIKNSMALTIPYKHFTGELSFVSDEKYTDHDFALKSNTELKKFLKYLEGLEVNVSCISNLKLDTLKNDLENGLYFESNIPQGFGIGSSGALCAAIYDRYAKSKVPADNTVSNTDILFLREIFSNLESYFHGTSSGIDPLNSYFGRPLLISGPDKVEMVGIPRIAPEDSGAIFVINSGNVAHTEPLVRYFLERYENEDFRSLINNSLIPLTNQCIGSMLEGRSEELYKGIKALSILQLEHFTHMIPEGFRQLWKEGIERDDFYLKLCGSGGGGFMLGFARNYDDVKTRLRGEGREVITVSRNKDSSRLQ